MRTRAPGGGPRGWVLPERDHEDAGERRSTLAPAVAADGQWYRDLAEHRGVACAGQALVAVGAILVVRCDLLHWCAGRGHGPRNRASAARTPGCAARAASSPPDCDPVL